MLNQYCERLGSGLLAEPLNAITNIVFPIAAWMLWSFAKKVGALTPEIRLLGHLLITIGLGSALFHVVATEWAQWLDFLPILLFEVCFFCSYLRRNIGVALSVASVLLIAATDHWFPGALNGSAVYAQTVLVLIFLGIPSLANHRPESKILLCAAGIFLCSLVFRTIDLSVCRKFVLGTHFLWHILNGIVLYLLMRSMIVRKMQFAK